MARRREYFTLEEANAIVPTLEYYFRQLVLLQRDLAETQRVLKDAGASLGADGVRLPPDADTGLDDWRDRYIRLCEAYDRVIEEILAHGVEIVDPEVGIVNFHTWCDGEELILNWQYGEPAVNYWLDPGEQYGNRRPLQQLFAGMSGPDPSQH